MKIVCDNCATKYSIADEKVRGKVFKIRCKKCSHIIVVRGGEGAAAEAAHASDGGFPDESPPSLQPAAKAPAASLGTGEAVWHLVVDREQIGPLTREEVQAKFRAGEVDLETYAWREGFADWLRLGSIDDFKDLAGDGGTGSEGATRRTDTADLFATAAPNAAADDAPTTTSGDLFGGHNAPGAPTAESNMPAADIFSGGGNALFGAPQAQAAAPAPAARQARTSSPGFAAVGGGGGGGAMSAAEPAAAASPKMTGQRNENSVLFSLNNLQALASGGGGGGGGGGASKPAAAAAESRPGFANSQTEGSGLIDIRAMAASTLSGPTGPSGSKGDEPSFAAPPLFSPMAAPILMPAPASGPPKWIWALLGVGVLAVLGIIGVGIVLIMKKEPPPVVAAVTPPVAAPPVAAAGTTPPAAAGTTPPAAAGTTPAAKPEEGKKEHHKKETKGGSAPSTSGSAPAPAAATPSAPAPKASGKKKDALDDLLDAASPDKPSAAKHSAPREDSGGGGGADLPETLGKSDIVNGMGKVKGTVANCYAQFKVPGLANVSVTIGKNGRVSSATVSGSFSGTPTGSCVERAVKGASFPATKNSTTINYPFMLR